MSSEHPFPSSALGCSAAWALSILLTWIPVAKYLQEMCSVGGKLHSMVQWGQQLS